MNGDRDVHFEPGRLWSLLDLMRELPLTELIGLDVNLAGAIARYDHAQANGQIGEAGAQATAEIFRQFEMLGAQPDFAPEAHHLLSIARAGLTAETKVGKTVAWLTSIHEVFRSELSKKGCFLLEKEEMAFVNQPALFGETVAAAFPSAAMDIREMGNCFAAGRYNAAAYHCVQAAEVSLRELARDRRVDPMDWRKPTPLENAQWGHLLGAVRSKIDKIRGWDDGPVKDAASKFYENALLDLGGLNDGWRRHLAHARSHEYERDDVIGLMAHTRRVMQSLARRIGERRPVTPEIWRRMPKELTD